VLQPAVYVYLQTQWSCVCPLLGQDLPWRGWSSPSCRGSPGLPAVSAHFAERNVALCMNVLSWWYNPFTVRTLLHSWSRVVQEWLSWQANVKFIDWPPRAPDMNPSRICAVRWKGQCRRLGLSSLPEIAMSCGPLCQKHGMKLLCLSVTFDHWLTPWYGEWNQWSKQKGSGLLIKAVNFWKQPL